MFLVLSQPRKHVSKNVKLQYDKMNVCGSAHICERSCCSDTNCHLNATSPVSQQALLHSDN